MKAFKRSRWVLMNSRYHFHWMLWWKLEAISLCLPLCVSGPQLGPWDPLYKRGRVLVVAATRCVEGISDSTSESDSAAISRSINEKESCCLTEESLTLWRNVTVNTAPWWAERTLSPTWKQTCTTEELALSSDWLEFLDPMWHFCVVRCSAYLETNFCSSICLVNVDRIYIYGCFMVHMHFTVGCFFTCASFYVDGVIFCRFLFR